MTKRTAILGSMVALALLGGGLADVPQAQAASGFTSTTQLRNIWVPSLCDNPSGKLVNGELPNGYVWLNQRASRYGQIRKGGGNEAVGVFNCSQGGIGWPDNLVFYGADKKVIGRFDTGVVKQKGTYPGRQTVQSVSINKKGLVTVQVIAVPLKGDNELWGSAGATVTFAWDAKKKGMVRKSTTIYSNVRGTAVKLLSLVKAGKTKQARAYASAALVKELSSDWKAISKGNKTAKIKGSMTVGSCGGQQSEIFEGLGYELLTPRGCTVNVIPSGGAIDSWGNDVSYISVLSLGHKSSDKAWKSWYATDYVQASN